MAANIFFPVGYHDHFQLAVIEVQSVNSDWYLYWEGASARLKHTLKAILCFKIKGRIIGGG